MKKAASKSVKDLAHNPRNPRIITDAKLNQLRRSMQKFGDISGIVFNRRDGVVYGGTQRTKNLDETARVVITQKFDKPTAAGTVAAGYVEQDGERFSYREVDWDPHTAEAAGIAANKGAGEWDKTKLRDSMLRLGSFDVNFDLDLTMFDPEEIKKKFSSVTVSEHQRSTGEGESTGGGFRAVPGDVYDLGPHRFTIGTGDLKAADQMIAAWEKYTGLTATPVVDEENEGSEGPKPMARSKAALPKSRKSTTHAELTARG